MSYRKRIRQIACAAVFIGALPVAAHAAPHDAQDFDGPHQAPSGAHYDAHRQYPTNQGNRQRPRNSDAGNSNVTQPHWHR